MSEGVVTRAPIYNKILDIYVYTHGFCDDGRLIIHALLDDIFAAYAWTVSVLNPRSWQLESQGKSKMTAPFATSAVANGALHILN